MVEPSWRLKLQRAEKHSRELTDALAAYREPRDYEVRESTEQRGGTTVWTYRVFGMDSDQQFAIILGDFLYNVRSALDHLAVACVPPKRERGASFPICTIDPYEVHSEDPNGDADRKRKWEAATDGMSADVLAAIRFFQPYNAQPPDAYLGIDLVPEDTALAILSAFQNADKHRRLVTTVSGLVPESIVIKERASGTKLDVGLLAVGPTHLARNGAIVFRGTIQVDVEAKGATVVAAGISKDERGPYRRLPDIMEQLLRDAARIVEAVEPCL